MALREYTNSGSCGTVVIEASSVENYCRKQIEMAGKRIKVTRRMLFTWLMLAGFILLLCPQGLTSRLQLVFAGVFHLPLRLGRGISLSVNARHPAGDRFERKEAQYQNYIANLEAELEQERLKAEKLSGLRSRRALEGAYLVYADVITASVDGLSGELIINRGQRDGLGAGQFVLGDNSIIGTIFEVDAGTARIRLITDPASRVEVKIAGIYRIMRGVGRNSAKIQMLSREHKVKVGDDVFARKKPGLLDIPMITGRITRCRVDEEHPLLWDITVEPACAMEMLNNVAVIIMNPQR